MGFVEKEEARVELAKQKRENEWHEQIQEGVRDWAT
jgi:hypothetical protein